MSATPAPVVTWANEALYISAARVATIYGWTVRSLQRRVREGRFPPPQFTRPARWSRHDLEQAWIEGQRRVHGRARRVS